ncbi:MAG: hypothetical protein U1E47_06000 [Rivihabitans pingtungensis]
MIVSPLLSYTRAHQRSSTDILGVSHEDSQHEHRASACLLTEEAQPASTMAKPASS